LLSSVPSVVKGLIWHSLTGHVLNFLFAKKMLHHALF
jgi:hypothetical protein